MRRKTLIIGSSPFALGYALKHKNTKIFEMSNLIDPIFAGTLCTSFVALNKTKNEYLKLFRDDKSIKKNKIEILRSEVLLSKFVRENNIFFRYTTFIVEINKIDSKYQVKYCDNEGLHTETFNKIIRVNEDVKNDNIAVLLYLKDKISLPKIKGMTLLLKESFAPNTYILNFKLENKLAPNEAKEKILPVLNDIIDGDNKILVSAHHTYPSEVKAPFIDKDGIYNVKDRYFGDSSTAFIMGKREKF